MGLFGTSQQEEEKLRQIAKDDKTSRRNSKDTNQSFTGSSAYETADEDLNDDEAEIYDGNNDDNEINDTNVKNENVSGDIYNEADANEDVTLEDINSEKNLPNPSSSSDKVHDNITGEEGEEGIGGDDKRVIHSMHQLDWDSEHDPDDPMNWKSLKKWYVTMTTAIVCLCISLGSSLYVSGTFDLMQSTGASRELTLAGLSLYLVGLSLGPALGSPISETFGRKIVYLFSFPISMLFTMGIGLSSKIYQILILRFFCGLFASPALAVAGGTINDIWRPEERGIAAAFFILAPFAGPVLGPIIGNFAAEHKGWKWSQWVSLMFSGAILIPMLLLPETYKPILLLRRAKKRKDVDLQLLPTTKVIKETFTVTLLRPVEMLFLDPIVFFWSFYIAFVFAVLFGFFEAYPIIFQGEYAMDLGVSGLPFIGVGVGLIFGILFYIILDLKLFFPRNPDGTRGHRDENGKLISAPPEAILKVGKIGAICMPISLFWLGWTGRSSIHWIVPVLAGIPFGYGLILIFFTNIMYFAFSFPPTAVASALGANNLLRYLFASAFPLFTAQMYEKLKIGWATSIFAFISLALLPIPWIFERYGPTLRQKSRFGYAAMARQKQEQIEKNSISGKSIEDQQREDEEQEELYRIDTDTSRILNPLDQA